MIAALALLPLIWRIQPPLVQDAGAARGKVWTQEELERVSEEIRSDIEATRGMKFKRPVRVKITDKKGLIDYIHKREQKTETPERRTRDEQVAKMLGLIPPEMDLHAVLEKLLESQVGGFYDPGTDTFYLMEAFSGDLARCILSHELIHALDDQYFDLDKNLKDLREETDAGFADHALAEGSAYAGGKEWMALHLQSLDREALLKADDLLSGGLDDAPPFLWLPLLGSYLRGEGFLVRTAGVNIAMKGAKVEDIKQAFEHPPRSSEQILHPEKYWDPKTLDEPRAVAIDASKLQLGWKALGEDTLGEMMLALVTTPTEKRPKFDPKNPLSVLGIQYTNKAAEGWGGDRALLLEKGDARALWLVTVWDTPEDAKEFRDAAAAAFQEAPDAKSAFHHRVDRTGDSDVVVVVAYAGVAERDLPTPTWKIAPKSTPKESSGDKR